jgi:hypothetical protein
MYICPLYTKAFTNALPCSIFLHSGVASSASVIFITFCPEYCSKFSITLFNNKAFTYTLLVFTSNLVLMLSYLVGTFLISK